MPPSVHVTDRSQTFFLANHLAELVYLALSIPFDFPTNVYLSAISTLAQLELPLLPSGGSPYGTFLSTHPAAINLFNYTMDHLFAILGYAPLAVSRSLVQARLVEHQAHRVVRDPLRTFPQLRYSSTPPLTQRPPRPSGFTPSDYTQTASTSCLPAESPFPPTTPDP